MHQRGSAPVQRQRLLSGCELRQRLSDLFFELRWPYHKQKHGNALINPHNIQESTMTRNTNQQTFFIVIILWSLALAGCTSQRGPSLQEVSFPSLNTPTEAELGERLLMQGQGLQTDVLRVQSLNGKYAEVNDATFCREAPGSDRFFSFEKRTVRLLNLLGGTRSYLNIVRFDPSQGEVCIRDIWSGCFGTRKASFSYQPNALCAHPSSLQQIIEYNGRTGDTLNFTYREFRGGRMVSPITQNFYMDLTNSDEITYKGARLKITNASNQRIEYRVLRNFSAY